MAKLEAGAHPHGWDGPVAIRLPGEGPEWQKDAKALAALVQDCAPIGTAAKRRSGQRNAQDLKTDLSLRRSGYKRLPPPQAGFSLRVPNSYAVIQDEGGDIPERRPSGAANPAIGQAGRPAMLTRDVDKTGEVTGERTIRFMRWGEEGGYTFARKARGFHIAGHHYLNLAVYRWIHSRGHGEQLGIEWVPKNWRAA